MNTKTRMFPLSELLSCPQEYFDQLVTPAVHGVFADESDTARVISAFIFLHQMKDWAKEGGIIAKNESDYWGSCPFAQIVMEIATGAKHQFVDDNRATRDPAVLHFRKVSGYGMGVYGKGPYSLANFQVEGRRVLTAEVEWHGMEAVLREPCVWWECKLKLTDG